MVCAPDGKVYAAGRSGTIVYGRGEKWQLVNQNETQDTFWGLTWFENKLYLSTESSVYYLESLATKKVDFGINKPPTCRYLQANDEIMCSIGHDDIVIFDGFKWNPLPSPY